MKIKDVKITGLGGAFGVEVVSTAAVPPLPRERDWFSFAAVCVGAVTIGLMLTVVLVAAVLS